MGRRRRIRHNRPAVLAVFAAVLAVIGLTGCPTPSGVAPSDPTITLGPPSGATGSRVFISSTAGATIYYTTDGSAPTTSSATYSTPIYVYGNVPVTVNAFAAANGQNSGTTTQTFSSIFPFSAAATIYPVPAEQVAFNGILITAFWDPPEQNLTIDFPPSSFLDDPNWTCSIGGIAPASTSTANLASGQVVFTYAAAQTTGTANITVGATGAYYFQVTF
jgi:hypothetical protein